MYVLTCADTYTRMIVLLAVAIAIILMLDMVGVYLLLRFVYTKIPAHVVLDIQVNTDV